MAEPTHELHLSDYLDIARRRRMPIVLVLLLVVALAVVASSVQTPLYRAEARIRFEGSSSSNVLDDVTNQSSNVRDRNLQNEVLFAKSDRVVQSAEQTLRLEDLSVSVTAAGSSDSILVSATDPAPETAVDIANTYANAYVSERTAAGSERYDEAANVLNARLTEITLERSELQSELRSNPTDSSITLQLTALDLAETTVRAQLNDASILGQVSQNASVSILNEATEPESPFQPSWPRNIALALVAGSILAAGAALLIETLDKTVLSKRDLERAASGLPVLAVVPPPYKTRRGKVERTLVASRTGAFTEAFRSLRSSIELGQVAGGDIRSILVTSANPGEGKSTVAAHLAMAFSRAGSTVLVVDADMHNPTQHKLFEVKNVNGLADHLANIGEAEITTEQASGENLISLIPAGLSGTSPAELLSSAAAHDFIQKLSYAYDLVIIDAPPLRPVADTLPLAHIADATLLVAMRGQTSTSDIDQALELLNRARSRPLGTVLCGADEDDSGYGYGYGFDYAKKARRGAQPTSVG